MTEPVDPPLAVGADRRRIDRYWIPILIIDVVLTAVVAAVTVLLLLVVARSSDSGSSAFVGLLGPVILLGYLLFLIHSARRTWRTLRRAGTVIALDADGLTLRTPRGQVRSTWDAVAGVNRQHSFAGDRFVVRFVAPHDPRRPGLSITGLSAREQRFMDRQGLIYSLRILDVDPDLLLRAVHSLSGGRVTPQAG